MARQPLVYRVCNGLHLRSQVKDQPYESTREYKIADYNGNDHLIHVNPCSSNSHLRPLASLQERG